MQPLRPCRSRHSSSAATRSSERPAQPWSESMPPSTSERYSRNEELFGASGQAAIAARPVAIMGLGGLGAHVAQQLAYLGTEDFLLVDHDHVTTSSMNRLVTADDADVAAATPKVEA